MERFTLRVNGRRESVEVPSDMPLLWVLRDHLHLTGTKYSCGIGFCGSCTVHLNGKAVRSCIVPIGSVGEQPITTIEGLSPAGRHPLQRAWLDFQAPQCGYCHPGQIMQAAALLNENARPSADDVRRAMAGNLCRCGTYLRILRAVSRVAAEVAP